MENLKKTELDIIKSEGGMLMDEDGQMIRFSKIDKPSRRVKKLLVQLGYQISDKSGGKFYPYMDYKRGS